jgi:hypothetical protein
MYRVKTKLPNRGFSVTSHKTATEALGMVQKIKKESGEASVKDRFGGKAAQRRSGPLTLMRRSRIRRTMTVRHRSLDNWLRVKSGPFSHLPGTPS